MKCDICKKETEFEKLWQISKPSSTNNNKIKYICNKCRCKDDR